MMQLITSYLVLISIEMISALGLSGKIHAINGILGGGGRRGRESVDSYEPLISTADIFYINPDPRGRQETISVSKLSQVPRRSEIKLIIHGYYASKDHVAVSPLRYAYLAKGYTSVYMADWNQASRVFYPKARYLVSRVGTRFARILENFLRRHNINPRDVHILGHSLGAHVAGIIGKYFKGRIGRITGLDPALPLFQPNSRDGLKPSDATFVDVIHTDGTVFGDLTPRGHADFYPNYGLYLQPGCAYLDVLTLTTCSHYRAPLLYAETIQLSKSLPSVQCGLSKIQSRTAEDCWSRASANEIVLAGENVPRNIRGTFFLETNNVAPYGRGVFSKTIFG